MVPRDVDDPVPVAASRAVAPFLWSQLPTLIALTPQQHDFLAAAAERGLAGGYTVPLHSPGGGSGLCSFSIAPGRAMPEALPAAHYLACFAYEAARRLSQSGRAAAPRRLTQRQRDCIVLVARGKSNWVAGQLLGLSADTVHKYLENAKRRYGVSSRTELVVRTLHDGQLSFADIIG